MRTVALEVLALIATAVFVVMMAAIVRHRSRCPTMSAQTSVVAEYLFALVPWLIIAASALPSVRRIAAGG
jgi:heme/copper-type cytochrome/quinol oxidase subunit 2